METIRLNPFLKLLYFMMQMAVPALISISVSASSEPIVKTNLSARHQEKEYQSVFSHFFAPEYLFDSILLSRVHTLKCVDPLADYSSVIIRTTPVSCTGGSNGTAAVTMTEGVPPFFYSWSQGAATPVVTGLAAGTYSVVVTDSKGSKIAAWAVIGEPEELHVVLEPENSSVNPGDTSLKAIVTGGIRPYHYHWSEGSTGPVIHHPVPGFYTVEVTDAHGCSHTGVSQIKGSEDYSFATIGTGSSQTVITTDKNTYYAGGIAVHPNPVHEASVIHVALPAGITSERIWVYIIDSYGQEQYTREFNIESQQRDIPVNISSIPAGLYSLIVKDGKNSFVKNIIVE